MAITNQYTWLITGCSRGIGLELTKQLLELPSNFIIATCRDPSKATALNALKSSAKGTLQIIRLDVDDRESMMQSVEEVSAIVGEKGLDYLINNAAINQEIDTAFTMNIDGWAQVFKTNVAAPAFMAQIYLPLVERSEKKTIVNVSSSLGAFGYGFGETWASYAITKTALNMLTYKQKAERPDINVVCLCPGWVKTDMGGDDAPLTLTESVAGVVKVITSLRPEDSGRLINYRHEIVPW
ncbi:C-factor [Dichomitus squalens LYAD-421 SS1]|uniref:C-factor n=2 Tax=Dichomitus squalens TaxID=114155 RepID=A0A4Q9MKB8_9APHY|nr:C-factor [Dichomitus squalens LYAD-421 SS1]EJF58337.1 C-factor [Dichomitus squalens LYAD-421 SS1]TBU27949.1 C-factor [Dichomitus squalens]